MLNHSDATQRIRTHFEHSASVMLSVVEQCTAAIIVATEYIVAGLRSGGKLMLCGNGGSAADAQHMAAELVNRLSSDFERPAIAAIALTTDTSVLTARANDYSFADVFVRQVQAIGRPGDVLIGISTSGNSENVVRVVQACKDRQITTVGLLGHDGGRLASLVDVAIVVPSSNVQYIQESHIAIAHILCHLVERAV